MATITNLTLDLSEDLANVNVTITYDVVWNDFNHASRQPYRASVVLIGDDTNVPGSPPPIEDGTDDQVPAGFVLTETVSSAGTATLHRSVTRKVKRADLNEDKGLVDPFIQDEIRAKLTLTPLAPQVTSRESNMRTLRVLS